MDEKYPIYKYQYSCPKCSETIVTPLEDIVNKECCYTNEITDEVTNLYSKEHIDYENRFNILNEKYDLNIPPQSIYNFNESESEGHLSQK